MANVFSKAILKLILIQMDFDISFSIFLSFPIFLTLILSNSLSFSHSISVTSLLLWISIIYSPSHLLTTINPISTTSLLLHTLNYKKRSCIPFDP